MWNFSIQTDHVIEAWRPDLVVVDKKRRTRKIIYFAVPGDRKIEEKEKEKIGKHQDLRRELQKIWNVKVKIIPLVVGSLGAILKQLILREFSIIVWLCVSSIIRTIIMIIIIMIPIVIT